MAAANQVIALLNGHVDGDNERVYAVALQIAASEARQGHVKTAETLRKLVDAARTRAVAAPAARGKLASATPLAKPRGELEDLMLVSHSDTKLSDMTLTDVIRSRLHRLVIQQQQRERLRE